MSKKIDFTQSPALAFLSGAQTEQAEEAAELTSYQEAQQEQKKEKPTKKSRIHSQAPSSKVRFAELPIEEVTRLIEAGKMTPQEIAEYMQSLKANTKSRRVQLVLRPNVYQQAKSKADEQHKSFNEFIEMILLEYLNKH